MKVLQDELLASLPPEWPEDLLPGIQAMVRERGTKIVVLDDDPTGTQTVCGVPVLTEWSEPSLRAELAEPGPVVYVLTNSRSMPLLQAQRANFEIATHLLAASDATGRSFVVVSRSDSTLRGHYPGEVEALSEGLGGEFDGILLVPFFLEGGRLTIDDTHYVADGSWLVPAAETEYARDAAFGYRHSNLRVWASEKHRGRIAPEGVAAISLEAIRVGGPSAVAQALYGIGGGQPCVLNAVSYRDLEVVVAGLLQAEAAGKRFLYRTAASFVRVRGGLPARPLLSPDELQALAGPGLIVAGSYVARSTAQIEAARALPGAVSVEVSVERLLSPERREEEIALASAAVEGALSAGRDAVLYTSRRLILGDETSALSAGQLVSAALVAIVQRLTHRPAWVIAKGGITSSDVATHGLGVRRASVLGQALPGVPVWRLGPESRWPGLIYVVFPGNVGEADSLVKMGKILKRD